MVIITQVINIYRCNKHNIVIKYLIIQIKLESILMIVKRFLVFLEKWLFMDL